MKGDVHSRDDAWLDRILIGVRRPSRYIGGEWNQIVKDHREVDLTFALAFPDVYEIGMSHLGFRILYSLINSREDSVAERVCCPWPDMADALRRHGRPLTSLESATPIRRFDVVGFSLQYEMTFTNVLEMLDLAGIPQRSAARGDGDPLVVAGGPAVFNVEPLAAFLDLVFVGDAEELLPEFLDRLRELKGGGASRARVVRECAKIEGLYAPALYDAEPDEDSGLLIPRPVGDAPYPVRRRILLRLDRFPFPDRILVPHGEIVHDRVSVEIMRGCPVGCRFCQAGYVYRPTRERDPNQVRDTVIRSLRGTGYDQFSLSSLNTGQYGAVHPLMFDLMDRLEPERVSISLSSMHASTITPELAAQVRRVRKSGFTIAPEAGSQRLRDVINKNLDEGQILGASRLAFEAGWDLIKLYFMLGLPTETDADVDAIVDLAQEILRSGRRTAARGRRRPRVTLSASVFVPKPETPFQWLGMERLERIERKQARIAARTGRGIRFKHHHRETSFIEAVFSRGDRALGDVLERAWRNGARFDGWEEHFAWEAWCRAFREAGVDPERYAYADLDPERPLPWSVVDSRVSRKWLALELRRAMEGATLSVCGPRDCHGCAPFAQDCVRGVVAAATGRPLDPQRPPLSTPAAPGPGRPAAADAAPPLPTGPAAETDGGEDTAPRYRYRGRFTKEGRYRFLSHLDLYRLVLRALRRARIDLVYSRGFNPKPRVAFGPALSVGVASASEYLDFDSRERLEPESAVRRINAVLPGGVRFRAIREIRRDLPALGEAVRAARYRVHADSAPDPRLLIERFAGRQPVRVTRERNGKVNTFDLAKEVSGLEPLAGGEGVRMTLAVRSGEASVRPEEVVQEVFGDHAAGCLVVREELFVAWNGHLVNPMLAAAASHAHRAVR